MSSSCRGVGCVVTGVAGFVGSHLAERLLALGCRVVGIDNFFSGHRENMSSFCDHPGFIFHERSIAEADLLYGLKARYPELSCCFHLAAIVSVPYSVEHPEETMEINWQATATLLRQAEELNFSRFVFAGSAAEYGNDQRLPLMEEYAAEETIHPSPYGRAKFLSSRCVSSRSCGVALRFFNIYGPRQDPKSPYSGVISRFVDMALAGKPLTIFGDGRQTRDFVYVSDVVEAYIRAAGLDGVSRRVPNASYNIGTGKSTSILELAEVIRELAKNREPIAFLPERPGDIRHSVASIEAFSKVADWHPRVSLRKGIGCLLQASASKS